MPMEADALQKLAAAYAEAWSSGSPEAVASFYAEDGRIIINRGEPWNGREAIARMAGGYWVMGEADAHEKIS